MRLEVVPISKIKVRKSLFRLFKPDAKRLEELKASIKKNGLQNPIVVNSRYYIKDGEARYNAMKALGFTEITVMIKEEPSHR